MEKHEPFQRIVREFRYRVNRLYTHPMLGDLLDTGEIDYVVLDALEEFSRVHPRGRLLIHSDYARQEFMKYPIIKAMLDLNIIFKSKYYDEMTVEHNFYLQALKKIVDEKLNAMNPYEHFRYRLYKRVRGLQMRSKYSGVPYVEKIYVNNDMYPKKSYIWGDIGEIYFDLPKMEEANATKFN